MRIEVGWWRFAYKVYWENRLITDDGRYFTNLIDLMDILNISDIDEIKDAIKLARGIINEHENIYFNYGTDAEKFKEYLEPYLIMEKLTK